MSSINELYKRSIFDHNRNPRNFRAMEDASHSCEGYNPLCGDKVHIYIRLDDSDMVEDVSFTGSGCAIFKASASFMTGAIRGKTQDQAKETVTKFLDMVAGSSDPEPEDTSLGKLSIFQGVREFPSRVKCATLAWHALTCAMDKVASGEANNGTATPAKDESEPERNVVSTE
ncbi:MAG: SUF system NifU family Fe-S cluster assembly protein [Nitrospinota bacterium]|nr:SUF system NifU family Fe-S cluster assembly protein [Nitrospinota bacterium]